MAKRTSPRVAHWLRENKAERYPRRILCLDSEAFVTPIERGEQHLFRLAVCSYDILSPRSYDSTEHSLEEFLEPAGLWDWIESKVPRKTRTILFALNLGYDLRITRALEELVAREWELKAFSLDPYRTWLRWKKDDKSLAMIDPISFVGKGLAHLAKELEIEKAPLPPFDAPIEEWLRRCRSDVRALREVVITLIQWLRENNCGDFRMTGAAQASSCFRHRFLRPRTLLVHNDEDALELERKSAWTGRCELWRHGEIRGALYEWDFELSYARIARDVSVPIRLRGRSGPLTEQHFDRVARDYAVVSVCEVDTDKPLVPTEYEGFICWPTGRFETVLWDNEVRFARAQGARVKVTDSFFYTRQPILRNWATWIIGRLHGQFQDDNPIGRLVLKLWARQLIGRFGLRYPVWEEMGQGRGGQLLMMPYYDADAKTYGNFLLVGRSIFEQNGDVESRDSAPAVMAYIMAEARCRLWEALEVAGFGNVLYCDTDSVLVSRAGHERLKRARNEGKIEGLRLKKRYTNGTLYAPRQVLLDDEMKAAGLPKGAKPIGGMAHEANFWETMPRALALGRASEVRVHRRHVTLQAFDPRRTHLPDGTTRALSLNR